MARLVTSGWEINVDSNGLVTPGPDGTTGNAGATRDTTIKRTGAASLKLTSPGSGPSYSFPFAGALERGYWLRVYIRVTTLPTGTATVAGQGSTLVQINTAGQLFCSRNTALLSAAINDGNWHRIELYTKPSATPATREWELRVDGTTISSATGQGESAVPASVTVRSDSSGVFNFDDLAVNDDQGSSQNTWAGEGSVVLLVPTADSAGGTGWTLGTGTALGGNGYLAVDNVPPLGVADLTAGSDPNQIRNAASAANSNYDATLTTYTAAGIAAGATLNAVVPLALTGAPSTTSGKQGTVGVVSNPAITNVALSTQGTAGAFVSTAAAGTFPTGWKWSPGTTAYAPSVTLGTAPVMRITQVTASTRIAMVSFVGVYVDYTPAVSGTAWTRPVTDTLAVADATTFQAAFARTQPDILALTDAQAFDQGKQLADTLTLADLADPVKTVGGATLTQPIADTLSLADGVAFDRAQTLADITAPADAVALGRGLTLPDTLAVADTLATAAALARAVADTLTLADVATPNLTPAGAKTLADTVALLDALTTQSTILRSVADTVTLADSVTAGRDLARTLADTLALTDSLTTAVGRYLTRALADTLDLADLVDLVLEDTGTIPGGRIEFATLGGIPRVVYRGIDRGRRGGIAHGKNSGIAKAVLH